MNKLYFLARIQDCLSMLVTPQILRRNLTILAMTKCTKEYEKTIVDVNF